MGKNIFYKIIILLLILALAGTLYYYNVIEKQQNVSNTTVTNNTKVENITNTSNQFSNEIEDNTNKASESSQAFDINDYIGIWYESKDLIGYSDVCLDFDKSGNLLLEFGIYRLATFDELDWTLSDNKIIFNDKNGTTGTITFGNSKLILEFTSNNLSIDTNIVEFNYKAPRTSTQTLGGSNLAGKWEPSSATYNGEKISLQDIYGSGIKYGGYLTLNLDNTYSELIGIYSDEKEVMDGLLGTYEIYGNDIIFTANNGTVTYGKFINGTIHHTHEDGRTIIFLPASN